MSLVSRAELTDRLIAQLTAEQTDRPAAGDFAAVCTDRVHDVWELLPIALTMSDGTLLQLRDEHDKLLSFTSIAERPEAIVIAQSRFPDLEAVRSICWLAFNGLGALRIRLARLKGDAP